MDPRITGPAPSEAEELDEGGDPACWAGLLCPHCGAVLDGSPHREGCGRRAAGAELLTFGHGTLPQGALLALLREAAVAAVVDVRTAPGSRRHPHVDRVALERWLPAGGVAYRWEPRLGGWRKPQPDSPNHALRNASFRGYADHMTSAGFGEALDSVLEEAARRRTAVMCSESLWWRCHRRLLADSAVLAREATVLHLGHDGRTTPHRLTEGARVGADGAVVYDDVAPQPLPGS